MLPKGPYNAQSTEPEILKFWLEGKFFKPEYHPEKGLQSTEEMKKDERESFCIVNPPPNAYMRPHIGNVSGYAYQDVFLRYNRMKGKKVLGQPGKDHAGIQGEVVLEKIFWENKKKTKQEMGREKFYKASYSHFIKTMPKVMDDEKRIGLSSDYDRNIFTLDPKIVETVLGTFIKMFEDNMVYKGVRIVNWDPVAKTTLADIDTEREERDGELVYINYPLVEKKDTSKIKTIVFDLNRVVFDTGKDEKYHKIGKVLKHKTPEDLKTLMTERDQIGRDLRLGKINSDEFWDLIGKKIGQNIENKEEMQELWFSFYKLNEELIEYIKELKKQGYKVGIISNNDQYRVAYFNEKYNFEDIFDYILYSFEEGILKPDKKIYKLFEKKFNLKSDEILLVDDMFENLVSAKELGWDTFLFSENTKNLKDYIEKGEQYLTVATTRAETMLGDTAVVVNPKDERYKDLAGKKLILPIANREIPIITSPHVDMEFGTGAVKLTPAHSQDDYKMMNEWNAGVGEDNKNKQVGYINVINKEAKMTGPIPEKYKGMDTEECREEIIADLKKEGLVVKREPHKMNVMIGERSKAVIEQIMSSQWFIDVERLKQPAIDVVKNCDVQIHPDYMKKKYLHWMKNLRDWPVSRSLWWGYRIPVWYKGEVKEEVNQKTGQIVETINGVEIDGIYDAVEKGLAKVQIEEPTSDKANTTKLTVIRHGETDHNKIKVFAGSLDPKINRTGRAQAEMYGKKLKESGEKYDMIISSDLKRSKETANIIGKELGLDVAPTKLIRERDFGILEGKSWDQIKEEYPDLAKKIDQNYQPEIPEGESVEEVVKRVDKFLKKIKTEYAEKRILLVTHSGVIRILRRRLLGESEEESRKYQSKNVDPIEMEVQAKGEWIQDPDVFDTWFSSGQWGYAPLIANDMLDTFFPSDIMETGFDILELWVSRMIMLSLYTQGKIPFKNVYLHGLVKAPDGQKMSKSKGNVIAPEEIIGEYGADALRLMYIVGNKAGAGYPISYDKLEGYRRFLNKIWNASKFVLSNGEDIDASVNSSNKDDQALLQELDELKQTVIKHIDNYRIGLAAEELYNHFWHYFCDKCLEEVKPRLYTKDKEGNPINQGDAEQKSRKEAQATLLYALGEYMKMLHPFAPFITERIWQELGSKKTIMYEVW